MRTLSLFAAMTALLCISAGAWATTQTQTFDTVATGPTEAPGVWYVDRYAPAKFESSGFDGDNRLLQGIAGGDYQTNSFYDYQGRKYDTDLSGAVQSFSIDLYVGSDWGTSDRSVGMWATGFDGSGVSAYPIIAYRNSDTAEAGFYTYDYINGGWQDFTPVSNFGQWYNLKFVLTQGTGVEYFVNGTSIGTFADADTQSLGNVILNAYNFGSDYNVYWDNFTTTAGAAVPEPLTMLAVLLGVGGLGGYLRRRKTA